MFSSLIASFCLWCLQNDLAGHKVKQMQHDALTCFAGVTTDPTNTAASLPWSMMFAARFGTYPLEIPTQMAQNWRFNFPLFQCLCRPALHLADVVQTAVSTRRGSSTTPVASHPPSATKRSYSATTSDDKGRTPWNCRGSHFMWRPGWRS